MALISQALYSHLTITFGLGKRILSFLLVRPHIKTTFVDSIQAGIIAQILHLASCLLSQHRRKIEIEVKHIFFEQLVNSKCSDLIFSDISGREFTQVGNSLIRYGKEESFYFSAKKHCFEAFGANLIEFRNEQEWSEVICIKAGYLTYNSVQICLFSLSNNTKNYSRSPNGLTHLDISLV